ncbi:hypothetical protein HK096_001799 [Nowakowskiella sp. JEL0078]|nr:hypothetical protein HK096_001799 [Nowakowskiella sp. JEL0078]
MAISAIQSRLLIVGLAILSSLIATEYDTSGSLTLIGVSDWVKVLGGWAIRWDAIFFQKITRDSIGYEYEQQFAFFPGFPILINAFAKLIQKFINTDNNSIIVICGIFVSNVSFILATVGLYKLTLKLTKNEKFASTTCILFTVYPAGVFMSSLLVNFLEL